MIKKIKVLVLTVVIATAAFAGLNRHVIRPVASEAAWGGYYYGCVWVAPWHKFVCGWHYDPNCPDWWPEDGICD